MGQELGLMHAVKLPKKATPPPPGGGEIIPQTPTPLPRKNYGSTHIHVCILRWNAFFTSCEKYEDKSKNIFQLTKNKYIWIHIFQL